ncbi:MAG: tyrosine-protein phosphatase [Firmicutes bacterium]|nr:tyrosine-protein phosphatase [Bacillota bacterium]
MKRYLLDLMLNTRDLGGYATKDGKTTQYGRFIRSDAPLYLTEAGKAEFLQMKITTILDFRTEEISTRYPSVFQGDPRFHFFSFPITEGSLAHTLKGEDPSITYMSMLSHFETFKDITLAMINAEGGVFYNCSAGKDRTGIVTFLLFDFVGVDRKDILEDYVVSEQFINERIPLVQAQHPSFPSSMGFSKKEYLLNFIKMFNKEYGTARKYLLKAGLTVKQLKTLKDKLLKE